LGRRDGRIFAKSFDASLELAIGKLDQNRIGALGKPVGVIKGHVCFSPTGASSSAPPSRFQIRTYQGFSNVLSNC